MKEKYEKPVVEVVQVEFNECIAGSTPPPGPTVRRGSSEHLNLGGASCSRTWGEIFPAN